MNVSMTSNGWTDQYSFENEYCGDRNTFREDLIQRLTMKLKSISTRFSTFSMIKPILNPTTSRSDVIAYTYLMDKPKNVVFLDWDDQNHPNVGTLTVSVVDTSKDQRQVPISSKLFREIVKTTIDEIYVDDLIECFSVRSKELIRLKNESETKPTLNPIGDALYNGLKYTYNDKIDIFISKHFIHSMFDQVFPGSDGMLTNKFFAFAIHRSNTGFNLKSNKESRSFKLTSLGCLNDEFEYNVSEMNNIEFRTISGIPVNPNEYDNLEMVRLLDSRSLSIENTCILRSIDTNPEVSIALAKVLSKILASMLNDYSESRRDLLQFGKIVPYEFYEFRLE